MKFITNLTKSILLLALIGASMSSNLLRKSKTSDLDLTLPADFQKGKGQEEVVTKANAQVQAARELLKNPGSRTMEIIKSAAANLAAYWALEFITPNEKNNKDFNRSINGGVLAIKTDAGITEYSTKQNTKFRLVNTGHCTATDVAGVLATLGDIGTAIFDCEPGNTKENIVAYCNVAKKIADHTMHSTNKLEELLEMGRKAKRARGGSAIAPNKKPVTTKDGVLPAERGEMRINDKMKLDPRSGLLAHNVSDENFSAKWPWQKIPKVYMEKCKEPWAGHYSGSIVEVLFTLDLLVAKSEIHDSPLRSFNTTAETWEKNQWNNPTRRCKAALAGAFLISIGYHSAIEVKPTMWAYLGRGQVGINPKIFSMSQQTCDTKATSDIFKLMDDCTAKK